MSENIPYELIARHLAEEASEEDNESLYRWLEENEGNVAVFEELVYAYEVGGNIPLNPPTADRERRYDLQLLKIAAAIALIAAIGVHIVLRQSFDGPTAFHTKAGEVLQIRLPDSTAVWLNGDTKLLLGKNFDHDGEVHLHGEAYFVRRGDRRKPLRIRYDSVVAILREGEINVQAYPNDTEKHLTVAEGYIQLEDGMKEGFRLDAATGEEVISLSDYGVLSVSISDELNYSSWMTGLYAFDKTTLEHVAKLVTKGKNVEVVFSDDALRYRFVSGIHQSPEVLQSLSKEAGFEVLYKKNTIVLQPKNEL